MNSLRHAVILAAGMATRLRPASNLLPKGLFEIGGTSLLGRSVDLLAAAGVSEILVVTGHHAQQIEAALGTERGGAILRYVYNGSYTESGSMVSLLLAAQETLEPILLLESDLLYHPDFITAALAADGDVLLAADVSGSGDEVYLAVDEEKRLRFLGKHPPEAWRAQAIGELAGISRLSPELLERFCAEVEEYLRRGEGNHHYEDVLFELAKEGWPIRVEHCPGLPWTEVDTPNDLARAEGQVWPRLAAEGLLKA